MARPIVFILHLYRLADAINFRKDYSPPSSPPSRPYKVAPTIFDAQSAPSELVGDACQTHDVVADPPHETSLTQNHPSKCLIRIVIGSLPLFLHPFFSFFPCISTYVA